ncbi:class A sortase [Aerococcus sp. UMB7834]|uniref:class A sortase n=1 Tax=Aerococcus sp. UMB7834 TaxID=3046342 RepID=UPI00254E446D|nr:class A sortase [Aerococcus sp. UMB7834]MDK6805363.1 class A sortase [Aerococcus sp. UMB7834]
MKRMTHYLAVLSLAALVLSACSAEKAPVKEAHEAASSQSSQELASSKAEGKASTEDVAAAKERIKGLNSVIPVIGAVAYPDADIYVPIFDGLTEENMLHGASTFFPGEQKLGQGNYPITSHNMNYFGENLLLTPILDKTKIGDSIYVTDLDKIYRFEVDFNEVVPETRVDLVDPKTDQAMLTLMTCTKALGDDPNRKIVQAKLVDTIDFDQADPKTLDLFKGEYRDVEHIY